ncbi:hypothetical protein Tco_0680253 [Tanacetum coccineum]|uniref:Uncharacterized protein n=1 Tax=Tanacetum coccineum TaxID=301880 RepID=A0ABQ4XK07_9ASTR
MSTPGGGGGNTVAATDESRHADNNNHGNWFKRASTNAWTREDIHNGDHVFYDTLTRNQMMKSIPLLMLAKQRINVEAIERLQQVDKEQLASYNNASECSISSTTSTRMVKICDGCQAIKRNRHHLIPTFDILKQYQNEVNDIRAERIAKSANPLALLTAAQPYLDNYYQAPKPQRSNATSSSTRPSASTRHKGKEIAKLVTPQSESVQNERLKIYVSNERQHSENNTAECADERAALANLIANLTLDTEENKTILKQLKKANTSLTQELEECKTNLKN